MDSSSTYSIYIPSAWKILSSKWHDDFYTRTKLPDLEVGAELLTKLALETILEQEKEILGDVCSHKAIQAPSDSSCTNKSFKLWGRKIDSLPKQNGLSIQDRVNSFVEQNSQRFTDICISGFPFASFEKNTVAATLKNTLGNHQSFVFNLMNLSNSTVLTEEKLNDLYSVIIERMDAKELAITCTELLKQYKPFDPRAGYYLLWLIKHLTRGSYTLPHFDSINKSTVKEIISQFIVEEIHSVANPISFINLFCSVVSVRPYSSFLYTKILNKAQQLIFFDFAAIKLREIPLEKWPQKLEIIKYLLEQKNIQDKQKLSQALAESLDPKTAEIGQHLISAFQSKSLKEALPHYRSLCKLFDHFNEAHIDYIFGRPFIEFKQVRSAYNKNPEFIMNLNFTDCENFFVHGSMMIGVYNSHSNFGGHYVPPHLMAYDMNSEELIWGHPLVPVPKTDPFQNIQQSEFGNMGSNNYILQHVGNHITVQWRGNEKVHFIDIKTGSIAKSITMPYLLKDIYTSLHIHPVGFAYQAIQDKLIGGKIIDERWEPTFECKIPEGFFFPLSTHAGFQAFDVDKFFVVNPMGAQVELNGFSATAKDDKLYLIEPNPIDKRGCLLTIRTLCNDETVVSEIEKSIPITVKKAKIGGCCENKIIILIDADDRPIFIDLEKNEVVYSQRRVSDRATYSPLGEIWSLELDMYTKNLWKITSTEERCFGPLDTTPDIQLLYADISGRLYLDSQ